MFIINPRIQNKTTPMTEAWKTQALEYFRGCGGDTEFLIPATRRTRHPGKRQNWKTSHRNFVYKPAICRFGKYDIRNCCGNDGESFLMHQLEGKKPVAFIVKYADLEEASWDFVVREELLRCTPIAADIVDYVLKGFLVGGGAGPILAAPIIQ